MTQYGDTGAPPNNTFPLCLLTERPHVKHMLKEPQQTGELEDSVRSPGVVTDGPMHQTPALHVNMRLHLTRLVDS